MAFLNTIPDLQRARDHRYRETVRKHDSLPHHCQTKHPAISVDAVVASRFNLLLLDHNDQYFEDYAVVYFDNDAAER